MNKRTNTLARRAADSCPSGLELKDFIIPYTDNLAELIVRECANRASWAQDTGEKDISGEILKHFGVRE